MSQQEMGSGMLDNICSCSMENSTGCHWQSIRASYSSSLASMNFLLASTTSSSGLGSTAQRQVVSEKLHKQTECVQRLLVQCCEKVLPSSWFLTFLSAGVLSFVTFSRPIDASDFVLSSVLEFLYILAWCSLATPDLISIEIWSENHAFIFCY